MLDIFTNINFLRWEKAGAILQSLPRCRPSGRRKTRSVWTVRGAPADPCVISVHLVGYRLWSERWRIYRKGRSYLRGVQEYRLPSPPLLNVMYSVRSLWRQLKYSLRRTKEKEVVMNLFTYISCRGAVMHVHHLCFRSVRKGFFLFIFLHAMEIVTKIPSPAPWNFFIAPLWFLYNRRLRFLRWPATEVSLSRRLRFLDPSGKISWPAG
jgi:hypothetical protein